MPGYLRAAGCPARVKRPHFDESVPLCGHGDRPQLSRGSSRVEHLSIKRRKHLGASSRDLDRASWGRHQQSFAIYIARGGDCSCPRVSRFADSDDSVPKMPNVSGTKTTAAHACFSKVCNSQRPGKKGIWNWRFARHHSRIADAPTQYEPVLKICGKPRFLQPVNNKPTRRAESAWFSRRPSDSGQKWLVCGAFYRAILTRIRGEGSRGKRAALPAQQRGRGISRSHAPFAVDATRPGRPRSRVSPRRALQQAPRASRDPTRARRRGRRSSARPSHSAQRAEWSCPAY